MSSCYVILGSSWVVARVLQGACSGIFACDQGCGQKVLLVGYCGIPRSYQGIAGWLQCYTRWFLGYFWVIAMVLLVHYYHGDISGCVKISVHDAALFIRMGETSKRCYKQTTHLS